MRAPFTLTTGRESPKPKHSVAFAAYFPTYGRRDNSVSVEGSLSRRDSARLNRKQLLVGSVALVAVGDLPPRLRPRQRAQ